MGKRVLIPFRSAKKVVSYGDAARAGGAEPVTRSVEHELSMEGFDGLLLMGGSDVNPARFGGTARPETDPPDDERDERELALIREAIERDLPIFGICRGLQILNVYHGGTLVQHLEATARHDPQKDDPAGPAHEVAFVPESKLARIAGAAMWQVNSRHHQAVLELGAHLHVAARDLADGTVEGIERPDKRFIVAVQWHPEDQTKKHPEQLRLFESFAAAL
jgi:gamma-glutamyl-gamma-aminobutyrate hydrolase PuuD